MNVTLSRDLEEDEIEDALVVDAHLYPSRKVLNFWLVVGDPSTRQLYGIKKLSLRARLQTKLQFTLPSGNYNNLKLFVVCDSYLGTDNEVGIQELSVAEGGDSDSDSDDDDAMDED